MLNEKYLHSVEEALLVSSYTYEDEINVENSPYRIINQMLWENKAQDQILDTKSYLRFLLRALRKLPRTSPKTLYRGVKNYKHTYNVGEELEWKGFSSTSTSIRTTQDFLIDEETLKVSGTLFEIRGIWGYNVSDFSLFPNEQGILYITTFIILYIVLTEIILEPMMKFVVKSVKNQEQLDFVVVEPLEQPLLLDEDIPPGCIQHIISALVKNKKSKEECDRVCDILCNINIDDNASRKKKKNHKIL